MTGLAFVLGGHALTWGDLALAFGALVTALLVLVTLLLIRTRRERTEEARAMDEKVETLTRLQAEMTGRMQTMTEVFGSRQVDVARMLAERIDGLQHRVGQGLETSARRQSEDLSRLAERLAVIDAAQATLAGLAGEVTGLKDVLSNKQARGAYGQGRMEAIVRDGLPPGAYTFQATLSNRTRPDCLVHLPGDERGLVIDAKFPLESFTAFRAAAGEEARTRAMARVRADVGTHVKDVAEKYLIPGETQEIALLFVPAESLYADLAEHFEDVVQRAHRARVVVVSPALLALAIQVVQALARDARIREEARVIQTETLRLVEDVSRLAQRAGKLDQHFRQAQEDVAGVKGAAEQIARRGRRIAALDFAREESPTLFGAEDAPLSARR